MIKVMIADDHQLVAEGIVRLLASDANCCAITNTIAETKERLKIQKPDVILLDIAFPDGDGIDAIPELKAASEQTRILMFTMYAETAVIRRAMESGANGYLLKNANQHELKEAIRTLAKGESYVCKEAQQQIDFRSEAAPTLTPREREILKLVVDGKSTKEIANELCLGYETVHTYTKYLRQKLGCNNMASLVRTAMEQHLV
ncbi:MAG: response regulator transcription factor [Prevotella sp.]|nr:response regulator transcription factor [Prevotella sp.]